METTCVLQLPFCCLYFLGLIGDDLLFNFVVT